MSSWIWKWLLAVYIIKTQKLNRKYFRSPDQGFLLGKLGLLRLATQLYLVYQVCKIIRLIVFWFRSGLFDCLKYAKMGIHIEYCSVLLNCFHEASFITFLLCYSSIVESQYGSWDISLETGYVLAFGFWNVNAPLGRNRRLVYIFWTVYFVPFKSNNHISLLVVIRDEQCQAISLSFSKSSSYGKWLISMFHFAYIFL